MSKRFLIQVILLWFVLLVTALVNAFLREMTYKPLLEPVIGVWAHQISSVMGIALFYVVIYWFLKRQWGSYRRHDVVIVGIMWMVMTIGFETWMNVAIRQLSFTEVVATYALWRGELWPLVLFSLVVSPLIIYRRLFSRN
jgi:hypothetical protein